METLLNKVKSRRERERGKVTQSRFQCGGFESGGEEVWSRLRDVV